jgi:hypothetical protein
MDNPSFYYLSLVLHLFSSGLGIPINMQLHHPTQQSSSISIDNETRYKIQAKSQSLDSNDPSFFLSIYSFTLASFGGVSIFLPALLVVSLSLTWSLFPAPPLFLSGLTYPSRIPFRLHSSLCTTFTLFIISGLQSCLSKQNSLRP